MKKKIQGIHLELTEALQNKLNEEIREFEEFISKDEPSTSISIDLSIEKLEHICHICLIQGDKSFNVTKKNDDMYISIDGAFKTLKTTYSKYKHKNQSKIRRAESIKDIYEEELLREEEEFLNEE